MSTKSILLVGDVLNSIDFCQFEVAHTYSHGMKQYLGRFLTEVFISSCSTLGGSICYTINYSERIS